jgi:hypothetical protein
MTISSVTAGDIIEPEWGNDVASNINETGDYAWTSFVPVLNNVTFGNAGLDFEYRYISENTMHIRGVYTHGSTSSISGTISLDLPDSRTIRSDGGASLGNITILDSGTRWYLGIARGLPGDDNLVLFVADGASYVVNGASPTSWASGDQLHVDIICALEPL